jgi:hypothetical protein
VPGGAVGGAVAYTHRGKRSLVGLCGDLDANNARIFTVLAGNPGSQACAGSQHADVGGEHVPNELLDAVPSSNCRQLLDEE